MTEQAASPHDSAEKDCGCGGDCGDCGETKEVSAPSSQARRALMVGAGSVAFVATLVNRRAFAAQCGPISLAGSLQNSQQDQQSQCGGLTPGFWKNHAHCTNAALGGTLTDPNYVAINTKTLGLYLPALGTVDPISAATTFKNALCNPSSNANHWATAILDAITHAMNPNYGYTISSLNTAILTAFNQGVSAADILTALETLENDFMTSDGGCANTQQSDPLCN